MRFKTGQNPGSRRNGVKFDELSHMWCARILLDGKRVHLGLFKSMEEAEQAYKNAKENKTNSSLNFLRG